MAIKRNTILFFGCMAVAAVCFAAISYAADKKYFQFPTTGYLGDGDRILIYQNYTSKNITGAALKSVLNPPVTWTGVTGKPTVFTPDAHTQDASTITGLAAVATMGTYTSLTNKPTIPQVCQPGGIFDGYTPVKGVDYFDGATGAQGPIGKDYVCIIDSGPLSFSYDQYGLNPLPAMFPYTAKMYENGLIVTPATTTWSVPATNTVLSGSGTGASFQPTVFGTYSAAKMNNWIKATLSYNGKTCVAAVPVAISKVGTQGPKGDPGAPGTVSQAQVLDLLEQPGGHAIWRQPLSPQTDADVMFATRNTATGSVTSFLTGGGMMGFQDVNGIAYVTINPLTNAIEGRDTINKLRLSISRQGTITTYHTDGTTPVFQLYSTGKSPNYEPPAGSPAANDYCWKSSTANVRYWGVCGGGGGTPGGTNRQIQYNNNGTFGGFGGYSSGCLIIR